MQLHPGVSSLSRRASVASSGVYFVALMKGRAEKAERSPVLTLSSSRPIMVLKAVSTGEFSGMENLSAPCNPALHSEMVFTREYVM